MDSILEKITTAEQFDAFITENMKLASYTPLWKGEVEDVEYSASTNFSTYTADYEAAMVASVIEKNADKPLSELGAIGTITGSIGRMGDRFQIDNDRLRKLMEMEDRFRNRSTNFTATTRLSEFGKIVKFLFNPYESAALAPHKRLDMLYFEGLSNGTFTINLANNPQGIQTGELDLKIRKFYASVAWNQGNAGTMASVEDIRRVCDDMEGNGRIVTKLRMTQATFNKMQFSTQFNGAVKLTLGNMEVSPVGQLPLEKVNVYLVGLNLPPIEIVKAYVKQRDGSVINAFKDDRITFQCTPTVAKMVVSDPLELRLPLPNRVYSSYEDNLISSYITEQGRFVDYEMWGLPVFSGSKDFAIMDVSRTAA